MSPPIRCAAAVQRLGHGGGVRIRPDQDAHPGRDEGAKAKGRLRGKQPKLKPNQARHLLELHDSGNYTQAELAELFGVGRSTIYRTIDRMRHQPVEPERPFGQLVPPPNTQISAPQKPQPTN
jgi:transposase